MIKPTQFLKDKEVVKKFPKITQSRKRLRCMQLQVLFPLRVARNLSKGKTLTD